MPEEMEKRAVVNSDKEKTAHNKLSQELPKKVDDLKYQKTKPSDTKYGDEMMTVKLRYKKPDESKSKLLQVTVKDKARSIKKTSNDFRFAASVAAFGMLLRDSEFIESFGYNDVIKLARGAKGKDEAGYRHDFIKMVEKCDILYAQN